MKAQDATITTIPFELNRKPGVLEVHYGPNRSITESGFDLLTGNGFDVTLCLGYPSMRAFVREFKGTGYATASAWIQIVTRREFATVDATEPFVVIPSVDTHPTLLELGVPFFAMGFPAEIFDAPCNNLNGLPKLEWIADTFLVTLPLRANNFMIAPVAGFRWGYGEMDRGGKRQVEVRPVEVLGVSSWGQYLPLLQDQFGQWNYDRKSP
ncbi:MAG: hypothetical protein HUU38_12460 [Anaerolineales bacterium]|nr:hypothetical protein [Anaerolineales bacterium]